MAVKEFLSIWVLVPSPPQDKMTEVFSWRAFIGLSSHILHFSGIWAARAKRVSPNVDVPSAQHSL